MSLQTHTLTITATTELTAEQAAKMLQRVIDLGLEDAKDSRDAEWSVPVAQPDRKFTLKEVDSTYITDNERFIVSLIVGYNADEFSPTAKAACARALSLVTSDDRDSTQWRVFDRKTGKLKMFEQSDFEA